MSTELIPLEGATSAVWKYFGFPAKNGKFIQPDKKKRNKVNCKLCVKVITYSGNTTSMRAHLRDNHHKVYSDLLQSEKEKSLTSKSGGIEKQQTIAQAFKRTELIPRSSPRWNQLTDAVCFFIARDMQSFDTVNDPGFRHLLHKFEPRYIPPDRKTIATNYIPSLFEREKQRIHQQLKNVVNFAVTTDIWTSRANHAYTGLTVHYIDSSYTLQCHLLETKEFPDSHTAVNIQEEVTKIFDDWGLSDKKLVGVTTDNGTNITRAVNLLGWSHCHLPCFSHTLQLGVEKAGGIPMIAKATACCRRLVGHFNHSAKACYLLRAKQEDLHHKKHALIQDVVTRWNSTFYMVNRVLEQQQPICATLLELRRGDLMPSDSEFATLESYRDIMKPLVDITEAIGAEKWVTVSTIRPILHKLLNVHLKLSPGGDSQVVRAMKEAICSDLSKRYTDSTLEILGKAAFLDRRFKTLQFLKPEERREIELNIEFDMVEILSAANVSNDNIPSDSEPPAKRFCGEHKLLELLNDVVNPTQESLEIVSAPQKAKAELSRYVGEESTGKNPLLWWSENTLRYTCTLHSTSWYTDIFASQLPRYHQRGLSVLQAMLSIKNGLLSFQTQSI